MKAFTNDMKLHRSLFLGRFKQSGKAMGSCRDRTNFFQVLVIGATFLVPLFHASPSRAQTSYLHHNLKVTLAPTSHRLTVVDSITLPNESSGEVVFVLHSGLNPASPTPLVRVEKKGSNEKAVPLESYKVILPPGLHSFIVS